MKKKQGGLAKQAPATASTVAFSTVVFSTEVLRRVRQHARSCMSAEICGVLIGEIGGDVTAVETLIEGEAAQQGGSHVTFTQDTWAHIYQTKDSQYPDKRIVGWYHSHPGFGVFLSDHDMFIQRNFFSDPRQVAWVYDPHTDEEGCFVWKGQEIVRLPNIELRDEPATATPQRRSASEPDVPDIASRTPDSEFGRNAVKWTLLVLSYLLAAVLGFGVALLFLPRVIVIPESGLPLELQRTAPAPQNK